LQPSHHVIVEEETLMRRRTTVAFVTGIAFAFLLGVSPLGRAAERLVLPPNSVGTAQLKNGAVTGSKIKRGSLTPALFRGGVFPAGPVGPAGPAGPAGTAASLGLQLVGGESGFDNSAKKNATASCPVGKRAISWSWSIQLVTTNNPNGAPGLSGVSAIDFDPASGRLPSGYTVFAETAGFYPDSWKLFAYVTCASS
jgi:hypothetical protein